MRLSDVTWQIKQIHTYYTKFFLTEKEIKSISFRYIINKNKSNFKKVRVKLKTLFNKKRQTPKRKKIFLPKLSKTAAT